MNGVGAASWCCASGWEADLEEIMFIACPFELLVTPRRLLLWASKSDAAATPRIRITTTAIAIAHLGNDDERALEVCASLPSDDVELADADEEIGKEECDSGSWDAGVRADLKETSAVDSAFELVETGTKFSQINRIYSSC